MNVVLVEVAGIPVFGRHHRNLSQEFLWGQEFLYFLRISCLA